MFAWKHCVYHEHSIQCHMELMCVCVCAWTCICECVIVCCYSERYRRNDCHLSTWWRFSWNNKFKHMRHATHQTSLVCHNIFYSSQAIIQGYSSASILHTLTIGTSSVWVVEQNEVNTQISASKIIQYIWSTYIRSWNALMSRCWQSWCSQGTL